MGHGSLAIESVDTGNPTCLYISNSAVAMLIESSAHPIRGICERPVPHMELQDEHGHLPGRRTSGPSSRLLIGTTKLVRDEGTNQLASFSPDFCFHFLADLVVTAV